MSKKNGATFPEVAHDFVKRNGADTVFFTEGPSLTRQEFAEECDINSIMARYDTHVIGGPGNLPHMQPQYADFTMVPATLLEYMTFMDSAEAAFMSLPAQVRKEFDNSPHMFVEFASDPENISQMRTWGLAPPALAEPVQAPTPAPAPAGAPTPPQAPTAPGAGPTHGST